MSKKYIYLIVRVIIKEYDNGDKYIGEWKNGKREGKGIHYWNDENLKVINMMVNGKMIL